MLGKSLKLVVNFKSALIFSLFFFFPGGKLVPAAFTQQTLISQNSETGLNLTYVLITTCS